MKKKEEVRIGLFALTVRYIKWCEEHPIKKDEVVKSGPRAGETITVEHFRPPSLEGMLVWLLTVCLYAERKEYPTIASIQASEEWESCYALLYSRLFELGGVKMVQASLVAGKLGLNQPQKDDRTDKPLLSGVQLELPL